MKDFVKKAVGGALVYAPISVQTKMKEEMEMAYWRLNLRKSNGQFYNGHFEEYFTNLFDLDKSFYTGKSVLDIGCGPLGSLEWADNAVRRVGADTLGDRYLKLNKGTQSMAYIKAGAESLPFEDASFEIVSLFNSLDHVEDVNAAVKEAQRVLCVGGTLLLIVEVDHKPTITEPQTVDETLLHRFEQCDVTMKKIFNIRDDHDVYASISDASVRENDSVPGILCAKLVKT